MLDQILNSNSLPLLEKMAAFSERRQEVLAGNIANIDTPGYKMRDLPVAEFRQALQEAVQLQEKLADAKARQKTILMRQKTASSRLEVRKTLDSGKIDEAMGRFDQYERKIEDIESQVEAYDLGKKTLQDEFAELEAGDKINDELEALKAKMKKADKPAAKTAKSK